MHSNLKHYFIIKIGQKPEEFKKFVNDILGPNDDITRFEYIKNTDKSTGHVLIGIELSDSEHLSLLMNNFKDNVLDYIYVNDNELLMSYLI